MEIHDVGGPRQPRPPQHQESSRQASRRSADGDRVDISPRARRAVHASRLARRVLALPETRPAAVRAARQALHRGELLAPPAIRATVRGMIPDR
ncbi:MAG: hypothetical protein ACLF0G_03085 [Candidatus Brocadiia bacterium]